MLMCPPATLFQRVKACASGSVLCDVAQGCHTGAQGAHTGDLSAAIQADAGRKLDVVGDQLSGPLPEDSDGSTIVVACDPILAIETGRTPMPDQSAEARSHLRRALASCFAQPGADIRWLNGGSVKPSKAEAIFGLDLVDGALVGGATPKGADGSQFESALCAATA